MLVVNALAGVLTLFRLEGELEDRSRQTLSLAVSSEPPGRIFKPRATGAPEKRAAVRHREAGDMGNTSIWPGIEFGTDDGRPRIAKSRRKRKKALRAVYAGQRETFACGCAFDRRGRLEGERCSYSPRGRGKKTRRIEWTHIVSPIHFGRHRPCWGQGGLEACRDSDAEFRTMELDMSNRVAIVRELAEARGDRVAGEVGGEMRDWGECDFEVDPTRDVWEPAPELRGDIARAFLYLFHTYPGGLPLDEGELARYWQWHRDDPPTAAEKSIAARIARFQGAGNPFVVHSLASNPACCKICRTGRACGDSCIPVDRACEQPPGCACAAE